MNEFVSINKEFINTTIWMSMRYSVGRRTGVALNQAAQIAIFLRDNPNALTDGMKTDLVHDIRRAISSDAMSLNLNIIGDAKRIDPVSILFRYCANHKILPNRSSFTINCDANLAIEEAVRGDKSYYDMESYIPWIKLAGYLEPEFEIFIDGQWKPSFLSYSIDNIVHLNYITCEMYENDPYANRFISNEYINEKTLRPHANT